LRAFPSKSEERAASRRLPRTRFPPDAGLLHISREHFSIELVGGEFFVVDRGSACGTIVGGTRLGGALQGGRTGLRHGDQIKVGTEESPYIFQFEVVSHDADRKLP
jgi:pSer/pThr/pTyr-binding forkhead associated (FHA) protein